VLHALIERSVRMLQRDSYTESQIERALATVYGVDTTLIDDGTYFVIDDGAVIRACGGWSKRATLHGGDQFADRCDTLLDPVVDAAKIRAFFVRPEDARQGLGSRLLAACEDAARAAGFTRLEMGSTVAGIPFYRARGYVEIDEIAIPLGDIEPLRVVRMERRLPSLRSG
jgi:GNAT superfamily N-acetyltransferase